MKFKKRWSAVISLFMLFVLIVSGCTNSKTSDVNQNAETKVKESNTVGEEVKEEAKEETTIEFWTISLQPTFTDFFNGRIAEYEKENPHVKVKWVDIPYDSMQEKLVTAVASNQAPDVVNLNTQMALTLAGKDALVDLNKEAGKEVIDVYIDSLYQSTQLGDCAYAFPWYASPNIMLYNKELFKEAGITEIPTTYEEANKLAKQMKEKTGAYLYNPPEFFNLLFEEGIDILSEDKSAAAFDNDKTKDIINQFKELTDKDILPKNKWGMWDEELKLFESGKLAIISSSGSSLARIKDEAPDVYEQIALSSPLTGSTKLSRNALMNVVVPSASKNHEEAINFAAWITNDENQLAFCKEVAIFPSTKAAVADEYFTSETETLEGQARAMSAKLSDTSKDYSLGVEGQSEIQKEVNKVYEAVIISNDELEKSLKNATEEVNKLLK